MRTASEENPLIKSVRVFDERAHIMGVTWATGQRQGQEDEVNLSPLIDTRRIYQRLRNDPDLFFDVSVVDGGKAIAWFNNSIDMSAAQIEELWRQDQKRVDLAALFDAGGITIISVDPPFGLSGMKVTITGTGFTNVTQVLFNNAPVTFAIVSDNRITFTVP